MFHIFTFLRIWYHMKRTYIIILLLFFIFITAPALTISGAADGLSLWYANVLPTLLPMIFLGLLISRTRAAHLLAKLCTPVLCPLFHVSGYGCVALLMGLLCGYPLGAVMAGELYESGKITHSECRYLFTFHCLPSPMFILGFIRTQILSERIPLWGVLLLFYGTAFLMSLLARFVIRPDIRSAKKTAAASATVSVSASGSGRAVHTPSERAAAPRQSAAGILDGAAEYSLLLITKIGLYMMCVCALLAHGARLPFLNDDRLRCILSVLIEMTSGISIAKQSYDGGGISLLFLEYVSILGAVFGGACVLLQLAAPMKKARYSLKEYLAWKLICIALTAALLLLFAASGK